MDLGVTIPLHPFGHNKTLREPRHSFTTTLIRCFSENGARHSGQVAVCNLAECLCQCTIHALQNICWQLSSNDGDLSGAIHILQFASSFKEGVSMIFNKKTRKE